MAVKKITLPDNTTQDIHDSRITGIVQIGVDSTPTANSTNLVESGGVKAYVDNAVAPEIFWATYGTTTFADVKAAYEAGKVVLAKLTDRGSDLICPVVATGTNDGEIVMIFFAQAGGSGLIALTVSSTGWTMANVALETQANKVTSLSSSSTDTQYPSAKCVYDELQGKQGVIDSTHKLDYSLIDNQPTIPEFTDYTDAELQTAIDTAFAGL